jgi:Amt family ammonium transporter
LVIASEQASTVASLAIVNTTLGACSGAVSALFFSSFLDWRTHGHVSYDVCATMNGCLTGLVAITAGCATVETWAAVIIGTFAGIFFCLASRLLVRLRIDDAVDAVPVHMVGGAWGMISTGLLSAPGLIENAFGPSSHSGWFYEWSQGSGDFTLMGIQLIAILFVFSWSFTIMGLYFGLLNYMGWFRVDELEELAGLDVSRHKGSAYDYNEPPEGSVDKMVLRMSSHKKTYDPSSSKHSSEEVAGAFQETSKADEA